MLCSFKCVLVSVIAELVRVKATLDQGLSLFTGAQGPLMISALSCCSCGGPWEGEREAAGMAGRGASHWGIGRGWQRSRVPGLTLSTVHLLLLLQVHSWGLLLSKLLPKNEMSRRKVGFLPRELLTPDCGLRQVLNALETETLSYWVKNPSHTLLKWVKKSLCVQYDLLYLGIYDCLNCTSLKNIMPFNVAY